MRVLKQIIPQKKSSDAKLFGDRKLEDVALSGRLTPACGRKTFLPQAHLCKRGASPPDNAKPLNFLSPKS